VVIALHHLQRRRQRRRLLLLLLSAEVAAAAAASDGTNPAAARALVQPTERTSNTQASMWFHTEVRAAHLAPYAHTHNDGAPVTVTTAAAV